MRPETNPLSQVFARMKVYDPQGNEIGEVRRVHLGEASASPDHPVTGLFLDADDDVPDELRERMQRYGYLLVDSIGMGAADRYVFPEQIERVSDTGVFLKA